MIPNELGPPIVALGVAAFALLATRRWRSPHFRRGFFEGLAAPLLLFRRDSWGGL